MTYKLFSQQRNLQQHHFLQLKFLRKFNNYNKCNNHCMLTNKPNSTKTWTVAFLVVLGLIPPRGIGFGIKRQLSGFITFWTSSFFSVGLSKTCTGTAIILNHDLIDDDIHNWQRKSHVLKKEMETEARTFWEISQHIHLLFQHGQVVSC